MVFLLCVLKQRTPKLVAGRGSPLRSAEHERADARIRHFEDEGHEESRGGKPDSSPLSHF